MQSVCKSQFVNIICLSFPSGAATVFAATVIVALTNNCNVKKKNDFTICIVNSMWINPMFCSEFRWFYSRID